VKELAGFTLIEILIALAIFAILATITTSAMYYALHTRVRVTEKANRLSALQLAISLVRRDTEQVVQRDVRGNEMELFPAFIGESKYLELTRGGNPNPNSQEKRSTLMRIAYLCRANQLLRRTWDSLDTIDRNHFQDKVLLDNLLNCQFTYLNQNLQTFEEWRAFAVQQNQHREFFPKAIQFNLTLGDWDKMDILFVIPEALYAEN
jgi:general secretion pathway protein J